MIAHGPAEALHPLGRRPPVCPPLHLREPADSIDSVFTVPHSLALLGLLFVVGGYNSSNTTHLVEIGEQALPTFFIRNAECLESLEQIIHFDLHEKSEIASGYPSTLLGEGPVVVGITAGASCPNNLIEDTIRRLFELRGIDAAVLLAS